MFSESVINSKIIDFSTDGCKNAETLQNLRLVNKDFKSRVDGYLKHYIENSLCLFNSPIACTKKINFSFIHLVDAKVLYMQGRFIESLNKLAFCFNKTFPGILNSLAPQANNSWQKFIVANEIARGELANKGRFFQIFFLENESQNRIQPAAKRRKLDVLFNNSIVSKNIHFFDYVNYRKYLLKSSSIKTSYPINKSELEDVDLTKIERWDNNFINKGEYDGFFSWFIAAPEEIRRISIHNFSRMIEQVKFDLFYKSLNLNLINIRKPNDYLHHFARYNSLKDLKTLIQLGADPCQMVKIHFAQKQYITCKTTALHALCTRKENLKQFTECFHFLRQRINIDTQDEDGNTPLHYAGKYLPWSYVKIVMQNGANPTITNFKGESIFHFAAMGVFNVRNNCLPHLLKFSSGPLLPNCKGELYVNYLDLNAPAHYYDRSIKMETIFTKESLKAINKQNEEGESFIHKLARFACRPRSIKIFEQIIPEADMHLLNKLNQSPLDLLLAGVVNVNGEEEIKLYYKIFRLLKKSGCKFPKESILFSIKSIATSQLNSRGSTACRYLCFLMMAHGTDFFHEIVFEVKKNINQDQKNCMCQLIESSGLATPDEAIGILSELFF